MRASAWEYLALRTEPDDSKKNDQWKPLACEYNRIDIHSGIEGFESGGGPTVSGGGSMVVADKHRRKHR